MAKRPDCRRTHTRYPLEESGAGTLFFGYPRPQDPVCSMPLRDVSQSGLAFVLKHELPGLEVGDSLEGVRVRIGRREMRGDILIMHFTPDDSPGSVCGALFYPGEDADLLSLRATLQDLEAGRVEETEALDTTIA